MMTKRFLQAFKDIIGLEGGYGADPDDKGNWTGGEIGKGELKGTKYGLSAARYPSLDIKSLTLQDAEAIYFMDWWAPLKLDDITDEQIAFELFDTSVNCGAAPAIRIAQRALRFLGEHIDPDGKMGPDTLGKINKWCIKDAMSLHKTLNGYQFMKYAAIVEAALQDPKNPSEKYGHGWLKRIQYYRRAA